MSDSATNENLPAGRRERGSAGEQQGGAVKENPKDGRNRNDGNYDSSERVLPPRGDYQTLLSFQKAEVVYDITFRFAHKYLSRGDRTVDQMIQSARSGKQNILEGIKTAQTSKTTWSTPSPPFSPRQRCERRLPHLPHATMDDVRHVRRGPMQAVHGARLTKGKQGWGDYFPVLRRRRLNRPPIARSAKEPGSGTWAWAKVISLPVAWSVIRKLMCGVAYGELKEKSCCFGGSGWGLKPTVDPLMS